MTATEPCTVCGHPAIEHVAGPTSLCIVCPDDSNAWQHPYTTADLS